MATFAQPPTQPIVKLSKLIKKARQLGCQTFFGTIDAVAAKNWLKRISDILIDMKLDDELKLRVATRLINKSTATWQDNLKLKSTALVTLDLFIQEFNKQYYTHFHRDHKGQEFFKLKQFGRSIMKYEIKLRELVEFIPKLVNSKEYLCSKFEERLTLEIREKCQLQGLKVTRKVLQLALRVEKLTGERMSQSNFQKRNGFSFVSGQSSKKSRSFESFW